MTGSGWSQIRKVPDGLENAGTFTISSNTSLMLSLTSLLHIPPLPLRLHCLNLMGRQLRLGACELGHFHNNFSYYRCTGVVRFA